MKVFHPFLVAWLPSVAATSGALTSNLLQRRHNTPPHSSHNNNDDDDESNEQRSLQSVWAVEPDILCDSVTFNYLQQFYPTINSCIMDKIAWDREGILEGRVVAHNGVDRYGNPPPLGGFSSAIYTPTLGGCVFDICLLTDTLELLPGQFAYDCSGVYCGPHAKRDCNGLYEAQSCPAPQNGATAPLPEIPTLAQVSCERVLSTYPDDPTGCVRASTACESAVGNKAAPSDKAYKWSCERLCVTPCEKGQPCAIESQATFYFTETDYSIAGCDVDVNTGQEILCVTRTFGRVKRVFLDPLNPRSVRNEHTSFGCSATLRGQSCSCTPCGVPTGVLEDGQDFDVSIDCSAIEPGTTASSCNKVRQGTGSLEYIGTLDGTGCPLVGSRSGGGGGGVGGGGGGPMISASFEVSLFATAFMMVTTTLVVMTN